jgi:hypothetical protein
MGTVQNKQNNHQQRKVTKQPPAELSEQAVRNLVGFFDVLIQMDFAHKQRNERNDENGLDFQDATSVVKKAD